LIIFSMCYFPTYHSAVLLLEYVMFLFYYNSIMISIATFRYICCSVDVEDE
jgi:hypothetical protein